VPTPLEDHLRAVAITRPELVRYTLEQQYAAERDLQNERRQELILRIAPRVSPHPC